MGNGACCGEEQLGRINPGGDMYGMYGPINQTSLAKPPIMVPNNQPHYETNFSSVFL